MSSITHSSDKRPERAQIPGDQVDHLVAMAARAPSVHNTQPWRFRISAQAVQVYADRSRQLAAEDPAGREMFISCGAAIFGLRLAMRQLGRIPVVDLLPDPGQPDLLAELSLGRRARVSVAEWELMAAVPHRHTHRGPFAAEPPPDGLLAGLQRDAAAEGATLILIEPGSARLTLRHLALTAARWQRRNPIFQAEQRRWTRPADSVSRDGVPARALRAGPAHPDERLALRDFDLGGQAGLLQAGGPPSAMTGILVTAEDGPADWLRAGQALNRLLIHAASKWVFADLNSQPMESPVLRARIRDRLALPGVPQLLLEFGRAHTAPATARRPVDELLIHA
jgi:phage terminase large subunit-like protein